MKRTVQIQIAGTNYRVSSDAEEAHLQYLASIVNERVQALGPKAAREATSAHLLAIVALCLADDLDTSENRRVALIRKTREVVTTAVHRIDARLQTNAEYATSPDR